MTCSAQLVRKMFSFFRHVYAFLRNAYRDVVPFDFAFRIGIGLVSAVYGGLLPLKESGFPGRCVGFFFLETFYM